MIEIQNLVTQHLTDGKSLRQICRDLGVSENYKLQLSQMLRSAGYDVRRGKLGTKIGDRISATCPICGRERTIASRSVSKPYLKLCGHCATTKSHKNNPRIGRAENHYNWKGGINLNAQGYIVEYVKRTHQFFGMAANSHRAGGYILQHRLVMARSMGRCLEPHEIVHHINGAKTDNRLENLNLVNRQSHTVTYQSGFADGYGQAMRDNNKVWTGEEWQAHH